MGVESLARFREAGAQEEQIVCVKQPQQRPPGLQCVCLEDFVWTTSNLCPWIRCLVATRMH